MHLTVPAITKTIKNLEDELGLAVLDRSSYRVGLNAYGKLLASHAKSILTEIADAKRNLYALRDAEENQVRVSTAPALFYEFLPQAINRLHQQLPGAQVHLNASTVFSVNPIQNLKEGLCDLAITPISQGEDLSQLSIEPLIRMELDIIASDKHRAFDIKNPSLKQLTKFKWLVPSLQGDPFEIIEKMFIENGAELPSDIQAIPFRPMIFSLFQQGEYLAVLPNNKKLFTSNLENFKKIDINSQQYGWTHYLVQRKYKTPRPVISQFIKIIKQLAAE